MAELRERLTPHPQPNGVKPPGEPIMQRRFELPDLNEHGTWLIERLQSVYPGVDVRTLYSKLHSILYSNEFMLLYQPNAVAIAQLVIGNALMPQPVIQVWFCFVKNRETKEQIEEAAGFFPDFMRWARNQGCGAVLLPENLDLMDVSPEVAGKAMGGRLFKREQLYASTKSQ